MDDDPRRLRSCLGHFATGVTVVTADGGDAPHGATVNAFTSVSIDPPLVLVSVARRSKVSCLLADRPFVVNVLTAEQQPLALHFAGRAQEGLTIDWAHGSCGPYLARCLAHIHCTPWHRYDGGDHVLFLGQVEEFSFHGGRPLLFFRGEFREVAELSDMIFAPADVLHTPGWHAEQPLFPPPPLSPTREAAR